MTPLNRDHDRDRERMSERELLIRIDERLEALQADHEKTKSKVALHEKIVWGCAGVVFFAEVLGNIDKISKIWGG